MGYTKGWLDDNRKYHVVAGDCLWNIALDYMGAGNRYPEIKSANGYRKNVYPYSIEKYLLKVFYQKSLPHK